MKKLLLCLLVCVVLVASAAYPAVAVDGAVLSGASVSAVPGESFTVPLVLQQNPGIWMMYADIYFDPAVISFTGIADGTLANITTTNEAEGNGHLCLLIEYNLQKDLTEDGTLANLTFSVAENVPVGRYAITYSCNRGRACNFGNPNPEIVEVTVESSVLTVVCGVHNWIDGEDGVQICTACGAVKNVEGSVSVPEVVAEPILPPTFPDSENTVSDGSASASDTSSVTDQTKSNPNGTVVIIFCVLSGVVVLALVVWLMLKKHKK